MNSSKKNYFAKFLLRKLSKALSISNINGSHQKKRVKSKHFHLDIFHLFSFVYDSLK